MQHQALQLKNPKATGRIPKFQETHREIGEEVHSRTTITRGNETVEIDLLVVNATDLVAIECKSRLTIEAVENHIALLGKIKRLQPRYASMNLYGAVAGIVIDTDARQFAENSGLFVIAQSGESIEILNAPDFAPARF